MTNKEWSLRKKIIVGILTAAVIFAVVIGAIYVAVYSNMGKVKVLPVSDVINEDYDSDDFGISGTISTGVTQDITTDQGKVSEILVNEGDYVQKGTPVVRFDSKSAQLELEQAKIDLQAKQVDLNEARAKLDMLNNAQSYVETIKVPVKKTEEEDDQSTDDSEDDSAESTDSGHQDSSTDTEDDSETSDSKDDSETSDSKDDSENNNSENESESETEEETEYQEVVVESDEPQFQTADGEVYKESDLRKEKSTTTSEISNLEIDIKEAQQTIETAQKELENCTVKAQLDGYVTKVSTSAIKADEAEDESEEEADEGFDEESAEVEDTTIIDDEDDGIVVQISSLEGLFVNSAINEWKLEKYNVGDVVYVMDWESGNTYEATITMISPYASQAYADSYQYMGGGSESYYPFSAQIKQDGTGLESGDYVDVTFSKPSESAMDDMAESGSLSIMKAFVRTENGKKYVYVRGDDDLLHKKQVVVSAQSQETYTITEGLTVDDYIAFPYGKSVREGAATAEGTLDELYE